MTLFRPPLTAGFLAAALLLLPVADARANDSVAEIAAGGLVLSQTNDIEMRSEHLTVSRESITVKYVFRNRTDRDIVTLVAFPLPEISIPQYSDVPIPGDDPLNFLKFETRVDGMPVEMKSEQRALALGLDHTELLKELGVPIAPHARGVVETLDALPPDRQAELRGLGLIAFNEYDAGKGWERHAHPLWSAKTTFYWSQIFPANEDLTVEHSYVPAAGASVQTMIGSDFASPEQLARYERRYCLEDNFIRAAKRKQAGGGTVLSEHIISYILTTGANWAGPIGEFTLTVDKGAPENLVSFCATGVKKIAPTRFQVRYTDYIPERDLHVLILQPHKVQ